MTLFQYAHTTVHAKKQKSRGGLMFVAGSRTEGDRRSLRPSPDSISLDASRVVGHFAAFVQPKPRRDMRGSGT